jgi:hypothetical protein
MNKQELQKLIDQVTDAKIELPYFIPEDGETTLKEKILRYLKERKDQMVAIDRG